jgi:hypothetical protein
MRRQYVKPEYPNMCLDDIDAMCKANNVTLNTPWRALIDDKSLTILTARDKVTEVLEGFAVYRETDHNCVDAYTINDHASSAIRNAARGWMRWGGLGKSRK